MKKIRKSLCYIAVLFALIILSAGSVFADTPEDAYVSEIVSEEGTDESVLQTIEDETEPEPETETAPEPEIIPDVVWLKAPSLSSISNTTSGVKISWSSVKGAASYRVYRKEKGGSFAKIAETTSTSYTDDTAKSGTNYIYTVRVLDDYGRLCSDYETKGISIKYLAVPALSKAEGASTGVKISWGKVQGASKYRVYRKTSGGSWSRLKETTSTSYTDKTAKIGTTYIYTVRAISEDYISWYDSAGVTLKYLATPKLGSASPSKDGVKVTWSSVSGASGYRVYRKTSGGGWSRIVDSTTGTSFIDTTAKTDTTYYYTVRALDSDGGVSSYFDTSGVKLKYLATPKLSEVTSTSTGLKVTWSSVSGASKYRVYRKVPGGSWSKLTDTTSTSYTDTSVKNNTTYIYTVRAINSDKVLGSWYNSSGLTYKYLSIATVSSVSSDKNKVTVKWEKVSGAEGYYVYRKVKDGSWGKIATVESGSAVTYEDSTGSYGKTYYYTVRAYSGDYKGYFKSSDSVKLFAAPTVTAANSSSGGIKVSWTEVSGASGYYVYRKTSENSWTKIKTITSGGTLSYTDTSQPSVTDYYYTVRAYATNSKGDYVSSDSVTYVPKNVIVGDYYYDSTGVKVTDSVVMQAVKYVNAHSSSSDSASTRFAACYKYMYKTSYKYQRFYDGAPSASGLPSCASYYFTNIKGNCYRHAAATAYVAKVLGYEARVTVGRVSSSGGGLTGHGWCTVKKSGTWYVYDLYANGVTKDKYSNYIGTNLWDNTYTLTIKDGKVSWG